MPRYTPEPTPSSEDIAELQRYVRSELQRISDSVNVKVDGAYGGLFQAGLPVIIGPLTSTPVLFNPYTEAIPERPDGVLPNILTGELNILTGGSFLVQFTCTLSNISSNSEWGFVLALNGVATDLGGETQPSNQTEIVTVSFNLIYIAQKGDRLSMYINSDSNDDATVSGSEFIVNRVSEEY